MGWRHEKQTSTERQAIFRRNGIISPEEENICFAVDPSGAIFCNLLILVVVHSFPKVTPRALTEALLEAAKARGGEVKIAAVSGMEASRLSSFWAKPA